MLPQPPKRQNPHSSNDEVPSESCRMRPSSRGELMTLLFYLLYVSSDYVCFFFLHELLVFKLQKWPNVLKCVIAAIWAQKKKQHTFKSLTMLKLFIILSFKNCPWKILIKFYYFFSFIAPPAEESLPPTERNEMQPQPPKKPKPVSTMRPTSKGKRLTYSTSRLFNVSIYYVCFSHGYGFSQHT